MVTCGHQFHTGDESDWLISSSAACPVDGNTTAAKILRKLIRKHCKKFPNEMGEIRIETDKEILSFKKIKQDHFENKKTITADFSFYSQPDNNHYAISQFLQEHYRNCNEESADDNDYSPSDSCLQSKPIQLAASKEREIKLKNHRENRIKYNNSISAFYDFGDFDETQHLDGCPVKWLYRKKSVETLDSLKSSKWFVKKPHQEREEKKIKTGKSKNFRDRTPVEMKIRQMRLKKRDSYDEPDSPDSIKTSNKISKLRRNLSIDANIEIHKKKLAAKLNWKPFAENQDDRHSEGSEKSPRDGYLPPRPLLGLRPLLSILLSPRVDSPCCSVSKHLAQNTRRDDQRSQSASLSITSLDLPSLADNNKTRPKTTCSPRWGSKASRFQKKLQTPNPITIKLRQAPRKSSKPTVEDSKSNDSGSVTKKPNEKTKTLKHSQSLNSLCYELGNKSENRKIDYFEQMIRELATEDKDFKIKRFLNSNNVNKIQDKNQVSNKKEKKKNLQENETVGLKTAEEEEEFQIICSKVQFFERPGKPMK